MSKLFITTMDNPFNPSTHFAEWFAFDLEHGYKTCEYLANIAKTSNELSEQDNEDAINSAIREIYRLNLSGNRRIIVVDSDEDQEQVQPSLEESMPST